MFASKNKPKKKAKITILKTLLSFTLWPLLILICTSITAVGMSVGNPYIGFNIAYLFLILSLFVLEKWMPFEKEWEKPDGQTFASIAHTISSKGTVQLLLLFGGIIGLSKVMKPMTEPLEYGLWPRDWPLWLEVIMGLYIAEFGLYWAHRIAHVTPFFWRFHAIHHSVTKLWFVNTGRFHFFDSLWKISLSLTPLLLLGAPMEVIQWLSAITAFIGLLTHCNVDMKLGVLNYIFSTPELHRWHHSKDLAEGNRNYGENIILWDQVFGTFTNPARRPPADIGMSDYLPSHFLHQLAWPFLSVRARQKLAPDYVYKPFVKEQKS